eukprot:3684948-Ditylum_brightwellii.AAC.1
MEYQAKLEECLEQRLVYNDNLYKYFALIWEKYSEPIQSKIIMRNGYQSNIYKSPVRCSESINQAQTAKNGKPIKLHLAL